MPATSVNFGPFGGVGMAAGYADSMRAIGLHPLSPSAAHTAFQEAGYAPKAVHARIAASQFSKVNTVSGRWSFLDQLTHVPWDAALEPAPALHDAVAQASGLSRPAAIAQMAEEGRTAAAAVKLEDLVEMVRATASDILGEDIGADGHFAAGHFDSLAAVELSNLLSKLTGRDLPGTLVFDYPSVADVARHLSSLMAPKEGAAGDPSAIRADDAITALTIRHSDRSPTASQLLRLTVAARLPELTTGPPAFDQDTITTASNSRCVPTSSFCPQHSMRHDSLKGRSVVGSVHGVNLRIEVQMCALSSLGELGGFLCNFLFRWSFPIEATSRSSAQDEVG